MKRKPFDEVCACDRDPKCVCVKRKEPAKDACPQCQAGQHAYRKGSFEKEAATGRPITVKTYNDVPKRKRSPAQIADDLESIKVGIAAGAPVLKEAITALREAAVRDAKWPDSPAQP